MDPRREAYEDLHGAQLEQEHAANALSADLILKLLFDLAPFKSVLDVGCGLGIWLAAAGKLGVKDLRGIEGDWLDPNHLRVPKDLIESRDLEKPFDMDRRFDLAITLEVAEHLSAEAAPEFVESLTRHSDLVLFSAAIPYQGGHHHLNEQFLPFWKDLFAKHGYQPVDCIRPVVWDNDEVLWWLRQNIVLFASPAALKAHPKLSEASSLGPLSLVHPIVYYARCLLAQREIQEYAEFVNQFTEPGTYKVRIVDGKPSVRRIGR